MNFLSFIQRSLPESQKNINPAEIEEELEEQEQECHMINLGYPSLDEIVPVLQEASENALTKKTHAAYRQ